MICGICKKKMIYSPTKSMNVHKNCYEARRKNNKVSLGKWTPKINFGGIDGSWKKK